jgi:hypothetical protein
MHTRHLPAIILSGWVLSAVAATPLAAADESQLQRTARVGREVQLPRGPGDAAPIATPTGDDDMPDNTVRPGRVPAPVTQAASAETGRSGWLKSLWTRWLEFWNPSSARH